MKFKVLASGSKGNCTVIMTDEAKIIIDMGISYQTLKKSLEEDSLSLNDFTGILITHCHKDHTNGLASLVKHTKLKVYIFLALSVLLIHYSAISYLIFFQIFVNISWCRKFYSI